MSFVPNRVRAIIMITGLALAAPAVLAESLTAQQLDALTRQADEGDIGAQSELANRYHLGDGISRDAAQAAFWYGKLADKGVAEAQLTLGLLYIRGDGIERDNSRALHWLNLAAEQRLAPAQYLLGVAHAEGHGVAPDRVKAYMWYEIAAAMDHTNAVEARTALASQMSPQEIATAEQMATDWWMRFHH